MIWRAEHEGSAQGERENHYFIDYRSISVNKLELHRFVAQFYESICYYFFGYRVRAVKNIGRDKFHNFLQIVLAHY